MNYKFQTIILPENHGFDQKHLTFLQTLDEGMVKLKDTIISRTNYEKVQEQINDIYTKMADGGSPRMGTGMNSHQVKEAATWVKSLIKDGKPDMNVKIGGGSYSDFLQTGEPGDGGYLVPELLDQRIAHYVEEYGFARRHMQYMPFGGAGNTRKIPTEATGLSVEWVDEAGLKPISNLTIGIVTQSLRKLAAISVLTEELVEDTAVNLIEYIARRFGEAIAKEEDAQFFAGVGLPWTGIINALGVVPVEMGVGETLADITPDHLLRMIFAVPKHARAGGAFYLNSDAMEFLMKYRADAVQANDAKGNYIMAGPTGAEPARFWGYPIYTVDVLPDNTVANAAGIPFGFFANLKKTSIYGDKQGMRVKLLTEATLKDGDGNTFSLAQNDAQAVRVFKRTGYVNVLPEGIAVISTGPVT